MQFKDQYPEWRQAEQRRMRSAMTGDFLGLYPSAIDLRIAIEHLAIGPGFRQSEPIGFPGYGRKIASEDQRLLPLGTAQKGDDAVMRIQTVDPLEALGLRIGPMQGPAFAIESVEIPEPVTDPLWAGSSSKYQSS